MPTPDAWNIRAGRGRIAARIAWGVAATVAVGLIVSALLVSRLGSTEMVPRYRFIDPTLRPDAQSSKVTAVSKNVDLGAVTLTYPTASLHDDTRYVLTPLKHDAVIYSEAATVPADAQLTFFEKLPDILQDTDRVAMTPRIGIDGDWNALPTIVVPTEPVGSELWAHIALTLPAAAAGRTIGVHVEGFAISHAPTTSYRTPEVTVPEGAYLAFGIGIQQPAWSQGAVTFSVRDCAGEHCAPLYSETIDPSSDVGRGWKDRRVSLQGLAREKRSFLFETQLASTDDKAFSMALWANPTIYALHAWSRPNIVLLSIDTLSAQHLALYGCNHDTAPFVSETVGRGGTVFERCVAAATTTPPSHMSMFTSVQPSVHGVTTGVDQRAPDWLFTLAEVMRARGYETGAMTEDGWLAAQFGFARGFDTYMENKSANVMEPKRQIDLTFGQARHWLVENRDKPFFLFLHTFEVHDPYDPPAEYKRFFTRYDGQDVTEDSPRAVRDRADYDREIRYTDDQLRLLFQTIGEQGLDTKTIFILVSDHGEEFFEHGYGGHGAHLFEEVTHVPLLFWGPGHISAGRRVSLPVGHIDLMPTILDLAGIPIPSQATGVSLAPLLRGGIVPSRLQNRPLFTEAWSDWATLPDYSRVPFDRPAYLVQVGTRKLSRYRRDGQFVYEYYDVAQDPREQKNTFDENNTGLVALLQQVDEYDAASRYAALTMAVKREWAATGTPAQVQLDPAQKEKLRALGYVK